MPSDAGAPTPEKKSGRGTFIVLWVVLLVSLLGNAFFVGLHIRHGWHFGAARRVHIDDLGLGPRVLWREMDRSTRGMVVDQLRKHRGDIESRLADIVKVRQDVLAAMKADPFDPKAYRAALERSAAIDAQSRQDAIDFFVDVVSKMSPAERKAVAARMEQAVSAAGPRAWHRHRGGPGPSGFGPSGMPPGHFGPPPGSMGPPPQMPQPPQAPQPPASAP